MMHTAKQIKSKHAKSKQSKAISPICRLCMEQSKAKQSDFRNSQIVHVARQSKAKQSDFRHLHREKAKRFPPFAGCARSKAKQSKAKAKRFVLFKPFADCAWSKAKQSDFCHFDTSYTYIHRYTKARQSKAKQNKAKQSDF